MWGWMGESEVIMYVVLRKGEVEEGGERWVGDVWEGADGGGYEGVGGVIEVRRVMLRRELTGSRGVWKRR